LLVGAIDIIRTVVYIVYCAVVVAVVFGGVLFILPNYIACSFYFDGWSL